MSHEDPGNVSFGEVGGLSEQIRELREVQSWKFWRDSSPALSRLGRGITSDESGTFPTRGYYTPQGLPTLRSTR